MGLILALTVMAILCTSAVKHKMHSPLTKMNVIIDGKQGLDSFIDTAEVVRTIKDYFGDALVKRNLLDVDIDLVEQILRTNKYIKDANAFIDANNQLTIMLSQRYPILRIMIDNGSSFYLDTEGYKLPLHSEVVHRTLILTTKLNEKQLSKELIDKLIYLVGAIQSDLFLSALIEQIHLKPNQEIVFVPKIGKEIIEFGKIEDTDKKLKKIKAFYKNALSKIGWNTYKKIDLRYHNQIVCKKK